MASSRPFKRRLKPASPEPGILTAFDQAVAAATDFQASHFTLRTRDDVLDLAEDFPG